MTAAVAFDTLKFTRRLKDAGISEEQAEAFSDAFKDVHQSQLKELATKADLQELRSDIRELDARVMGELRLNRWMLVLVIAVTVLPSLKTLFGM